MTLLGYAGKVGVGASKLTSGRANGALPGRHDLPRHGITALGKSGYAQTDEKADYLCVKLCVKPHDFQKYPRAAGYATARDHTREKGPPTDGSAVSGLVS
jgi:hypothetical protein